MNKKRKYVNLRSYSHTHETRFKELFEGNKIRVVMVISYKSPGDFFPDRIVQYFIFHLFFPQIWHFFYSWLLTFPSFQKDFITPVFLSKNATCMENIIQWHLIPISCWHESHCWLQTSAAPPFLWLFALCIFIPLHVKHVSTMEFRAHQLWTLTSFCCFSFPFSPWFFTSFIILNNGWSGESFWSLQPYNCL